MERHVIGMCLQFLFVIIMWFAFRRFAGKTEQPARQTPVGNGHLKNGALICNGTDYYQQNGKYFINTLYFTSYFLIFPEDNKPEVEKNIFFLGSWG